MTLTAAYAQRIESGALRPDAAQTAALAALHNLASQIKDYKPRRQNRLGLLWHGRTPPPQGLYLWGDVGRGKSLLMDLFFDAAEVEKKRRVHFHHFMLEIQARLYADKDEEKPDILSRLARAIADETFLLCFDEFHVDNIADAMILGRLFAALIDAGVVIVATSNLPPDDLYKNGLQRERFLPFIDLIRRHMAICHLDGAVDHRFEQTRTLSCYLHPLGAATTQKLQRLFFQLSDNADPQILTLPVQGRSLRLTHTAKGVGFFTFADLCVTALGSADYLAIAKCLNTVIIDEVPRLTAERRDETTRFVTLIDVLYEAKVKLYLGAAAAPDKLAPAGELSFPFQRTVSRLMEMQSEDYRKKGHVV